MLLLVLVAGCYQPTKLPDNVGDGHYHVTSIDATYRARKPQFPKPVLQAPYNADVTYDYVVGQGDVLELTLYVIDPSGASGLRRIIPQAPPLQSETEFVVDAAGFVVLPYAGRVHVGGLTLTRLRDVMDSEMRKYFRDPQLTVSIAEFASERAIISGDVKEPQEFTLSDKPLTVMGALSLAKGVNQSADLRRATLTHVDGRVEQLDLQALIYDGEARYNKVLVQGDTLNVPRGAGNKLFIIGEAKEPQTVLMDVWGMSLTEALGEVKGLNLETADPRQIYVIREAATFDIAHPEQLALFHLNASDPRAYVYGDRFVMQPRDVIFVGTQPVTNWNRFIAQFLPAGTAGLVQPSPYLID